MLSLPIPARTSRLVAGGLLASAVLALSGCSAQDEAQIRRLALPVASSEEATHVHTMWMWSWLAAMLVGALVWGLIFYAAIRFRRRNEREIPLQTRYNLPIEVFYTLAPLMMVIVFFYFTVDEQQKISHNVKNPAETITVVGQQWSWTFNYNLGYDKASNTYKAVGGKQVVYDGGTTGRDRPTLYLVKGKSVEFDLFSPDVIHSFWVPAFLYKMDVVPGRHNSFGITPTRAGTFEGRCAELCGVYHSRMLFTVKVVSQQEYDAHLASLAKQGNTGPALGASQVRTTPGLESSTSTNGGSK